MAIRAIVLAAGEGTRMKSTVPKVLHDVAGRPLLAWVLDAVKATEPDHTIVVVGPNAPEVETQLPAGVERITQEEQLGTGHAVEVALTSIGDVSGDTVVVVPGDAPLMDQRLVELLETHRQAEPAVTFLTADLDDPSGYGRVVRSEDGEVVGVVEHADAVGEQLSITEVNAGMYAFDGARLSAALAAIDRDNAQREFYLPDVIALLAADGHRLEAVMADPDDIRGVNSHDQLAHANAVAARRINSAWMQRGVWMLDPGRVYLDASVTLGSGVRLYPGVHLEGSTAVGDDTQVGPEVFAVDSTIGSDSRVWYSVLRDVQVGDQVEVGPYASLRPGTVLERGSKAGTFVEIKNTQVREGAKVPHLAYMGDAEIGPKANIGAGSITCNYDGVEKHRTIIGGGAFIGSATMLVAPVEIGEGAFTGAGSAITKDVAAEALGVERSTQREVPGYAARVEERRRRRAED